VFILPGITHSYVDYTLIEGWQHGYTGFNTELQKNTNTKVKKNYTI